MKVHIIGGGTVFHVRPHLAITAPAYGQVACLIAWQFLCNKMHPFQVHLSKSGRASLLDYPALQPFVGTVFDTNEDLKGVLDTIVADPEPSIVFMTAAVCDFEGSIVEEVATLSGKEQPRLQTKNGEHHLLLTPSDKLIGRIRSKHAPKPRKDIFLVGCKTTTGSTDDEMFLAGLKLLKDASCNLVLVNDLHRRQNMIVTPEQARYAVGPDRYTTISSLATMVIRRAGGTFTRSTVVPGDPVPWTDERVHPTLRAVVDHCIAQGAYKDILQRGATVGHFAQKLDSNRFLTSRRNADFNKMSVVGLVEVEAQGDDRVIAHGFRPSVGGQSQRIIFADHPDTDCIVHAHVPLKPGAGTGDDGYGPIGQAPQWANECGSHQCGENTSRNLREVAPGIKAVFLEKHGPNVVFHHSVDPQRVIDYLNTTFDFSRHTGEM